MSSKQGGPPINTLLTMLMPTKLHCLAHADGNLHELNKKNVEFTLKWDIMDHAKPFNPVSGICSLCTKEKYYIAFKPAWATLNSRSEMYSSCRHKTRMLLCEDKT